MKDILEKKILKSSNIEPRSVVTSPTLQMKDFVGVRLDPTHHKSCIPDFRKVVKHRHPPKVVKDALPDPARHIEKPNKIIDRTLSSYNIVKTTETKPRDQTNYQENVQNFLKEINTKELELHRRSLWSIYKDRIMSAYHHRRIFIQYRGMPSVRRALLERGWLEKLNSRRYKKYAHMTDDEVISLINSNKGYEVIAITRLLQSFPAFFFWQAHSQPDFARQLQPFRNIVRRGRSLNFTTKIGLIGCAEQSLWCSQDGVSCMTYPRVYRVSLNNDERVAFFRDFQLTQCVSLLRYVKDKFKETGKVFSPAGCVPMSILEFALTHIKKHLDELEDRDDLEDQFVEQQSDDYSLEWIKFDSFFKDIINDAAKVNASFKQIFDFLLQAENYLKKFIQKYPNSKWDGYRNLWILKPGYQCRGHGIIIRNDIDAINRWISERPNRKYIVQKYIECPLLVFNTKFDIRQFMLVSITRSKVHIWLYKDCYLRFSGQEFDLQKLHNSIHLTNNSVQKFFKVSKTRDERLPKCNMWSLAQFKTYLLNQNISEKLWDSRTFNGFKENLRAVVWASLEETDLVPNAFELYGCDFMLDEELYPILLEINANPDLSPSTPVTARLCPSVLKDLVKVVVDLPMNRYAPTGGFELVHEFNYTLTKNLDNDLKVDGKSMVLTPTKENGKIFTKEPTSTSPRNLMKRAVTADKVRHRLNFKVILEELKKKKSAGKCKIVQNRRNRRKPTAK